MKVWSRRTRARVAVVLGANAVAVGLLAWMLSGPGVSAAGEEAESTERVELSPLPATRRPPLRFLDRAPAGAPRAGVAATARTVTPAVEPAVEPTVEPTAAAGAARGRDAKLQGRIATAIANAVARARKLSKGKVDAGEVTVAVHVRDVGHERELVAIRSNLPLRPASNLKLMTCATALVLLGPEWEFETRVEARGEVRGGALHGDLVVRAGGDPVYEMERTGAIDTWAAPLVRALEQAGIARVAGALVLDEGGFLEPGPGPEWPAPGEHWKEYAALSGGFSANAGCITATIDAGARGGPAAVRVRPRAHGLARKGKVTTTDAGTTLNVAVEARRRGLTVRGSVPLGTADYVARFAHPDPVELFGHALVGELGRRGAPVEGGFRRERGSPAGRALVTLKSPLERALVPVLLESNNSVADQVFLATGHAVLGAGDRAGGRAAAERALEALGVSPAGFVQVDGSGLSRANRVSARQLTALVQAVLAKGGEAARLYREALPVAGESGTLDGRMRASPARGRVRAKTGFIGGTSALSGLARTEDERTLAFSILVAYPRFGGLNTSVWKPMQDEICKLLVTSRESGNE